MKKTIPSLLLTFALTIGMTPGAHAQWEPEFPLEGASIYLVNLTTGEQIIARNIHERRSPASLTKMLAVLLMLEQGLDWNQTLTVPQRLVGELKLIERENGMSLNMQPGDKFTVEQLLYLTMLASCNDAASVLADYVAGSVEAFVDRMNTRARELGCTETQFNCVHGLFEEIGDGNWSSAADMAKIALECIKNPQFVQLMTASEYRLSPSEDLTDRRIYTTNPLQTPDSALYRPYDRGVKTGYTTWADKCFVTVFEGEDTAYLLVEMGVPHRNSENGNPLVFEQAAQLGDWVTETFHLEPLVTEGEDFTFTNVRYSSDGDTLRLLTAGGLIALVHEGDSITREIQKPEQLEAPITAGTAVGSVTYFRNGEALGTVELVAAADMKYSTLAYLKTTVSEFIDKLLGKGR